MQDNEKLVERLKLHRSWRDSHGELNSAPNDAATTIEAQAREIAELRAEVERRKYDGIHTCHERCKRPACVARRERDQARAEVGRLKLTNAAIVQQSQIVAQSDERTRAKLTETQARLAEAERLLAEVFADNGKLNSLAWMDATAGVIAKQEGA